jgi:hypothetical protein
VSLVLESGGFTAVKLRYFRADEEGAAIMMHRFPNSVRLGVAGGAILIFGFLLGRAIGSSGSSTVTRSMPTGITTRNSALPIPGLEEAAHIPVLETTEPAVEAQTPTEASGEEEAAASTPTSEVVEEPSSSEPAPEVTVAPNR